MISCKYCNHAPFRSSSGLSAHMRIQHPEEYRKLADQNLTVTGKVREKSDVYRGAKTGLFQLSTSRFLTARQLMDIQSFVVEQIKEKEQERHELESQIHAVDGKLQQLYHILSVTRVDLPVKTEVKPRPQPQVKSQIHSRAARRKGELTLSEYVRSAAASGQAFSVKELASAVLRAGYRTNSSHQMLQRSVQSRISEEKDDWIKVQPGVYQLNPLKESFNQAQEMST